LSSLLDHLDQAPSLYCCVFSCCLILRHSLLFCTEL